MLLKKIAIISHRAYRGTIEGLIKRGYRVILVYPYFMGDKAISSHPDLQIFLFKKKVIVAPNISSFTLKQLFKLIRGERKIIYGKKTLYDSYPKDIPYNAIVVGKYFIANLKYMDPVLLKSVQNDGLHLIHVNQGYVRCTTIPLNKNTVLTEDKGIAKILANLGIDVLFFKPGPIEIEEYNYGFFAGASGIDNNTIYINGDIRFYPYKEKLVRSLNKLGIKIESLMLNKPIRDVGSIFFLNILENQEFFIG